MTETVGSGVGGKFVTCDPIFERTEISFTETTEPFGAFCKLARSWIGLTGRGLEEITDLLRWTAGYVVAWIGHEGFQAETRQLVLGEVNRNKLHVALVHSLGSLGRCHRSWAPKSVSMQRFHSRRDAAGKSPPETCPAPMRRAPRVRHPPVRKSRRIVAYGISC
jgi:hypothetical protein